MGGSWAEDYRKFITDFSDPHEFIKLMEPPGSIYRSTVYPQFAPHISVAFDPMPEWMERTRQDISDRNGRPYQSGQDDPQQNAAYAGHFRVMRQDYRRRAANYEDDVEDQLDNIVDTATGRALLQEIENAAVARPVSLKIVPYHGTDPNAETGPRHVTKIKDATAMGRRVDYTNPKNLLVGTGRGSDALINFTAGKFKKSHDPGSRPDEILFHEMVHASRGMRGQLDLVPVDAGYDQEEDYLAIVLTNIYMSDKGLTSFRGNHGEFVGLNFKVANFVLEGDDVNNFLANVQNVNMAPVTLLENFRLSQPDFYNALARLPSSSPKINWVRDYEWQRLAVRDAAIKQGIIRPFRAPLQ
jgi:hypothetical protein